MFRDSLGVGTAAFSGLFWTLKAHFGVSAEALVICLDELGLIDRKLRTRLRDDLRAYYKKHPAAKEPNPPRALRNPNLRWEVMG